jgi:hypothetical protein
MACYHCRRADKKTTWRGLCYTCYKDDKVRALYPKYRVSDYEPTQEELDQMIAEQLACKPSWWYSSRDEKKDAIPEAKAKDDFGMAAQRLPRKGRRVVKKTGDDS